MTAPDFYCVSLAASRIATPYIDRDDVARDKRRGHDQSPPSVGHPSRFRQFACESWHVKLPRGVERSRTYAARQSSIVMPFSGVLDAVRDIRTVWGGEDQPLKTFRRGVRVRCTGNILSP